MIASKETSVMAKGQSLRMLAESEGKVWFEWERRTPERVGMYL